MACLIDGPVLLEYFPTKGCGAEGGEEDDEAMGWKGGGERGERREQGNRPGDAVVRSHGRLERRTAFINASSEPQRWADAVARPPTDSPLREGHTGTKGQRWW